MALKVNIELGSKTWFVTLLFLFVLYSWIEHVFVEHIFIDKWPFVETAGLVIFILLVIYWFWKKDIKF